MNNFLGIKFTLTQLSYQSCSRRENCNDGSNFYIITVLKNYFLQNALNAQRVAALVKTAETMGILDTSSETTKQSDIDEILGFLAALEKVSEIRGF